MQPHQPKFHRAIRRSGVGNRRTDPWLRRYSWRNSHHSGGVLPPMRFQSSGSHCLAPATAGFIRVTVGLPLLPVVYVPYFDDLAHAGHRHSVPQKRLISGSGFGFSLRQPVCGQRYPRLGHLDFKRLELGEENFPELVPFIVAGKFGHKPAGPLMQNFVTQQLHKPECPSIAYNSLGCLRVKRVGLGGVFEHVVHDAWNGDAPTIVNNVVLGTREIHLGIHRNSEPSQESLFAKRESPEFPTLALLTPFYTHFSPFPTINLQNSSAVCKQKQSKLSDAKADLFPNKVLMQS